MASDVSSRSPQLPFTQAPLERGASLETAGAAASRRVHLAWTGALVAKGLLLAAVLGLHFHERLETALTQPLSTRAGHSFVYCVSFSLMAGQGFQLVGFPNVPEAAPLVDFLMLQRDHVTREELRACFNHPQARPSRALSVWEPMLHTTRVLDIYAAALLWKVFGISWKVYFTAYAVVSTLACLLVFGIGRRLGGSYWPGLFAAVLFLASPLENEFASRTIRDISPLWFAILGFFVLACVADAFRARSLNLASFLVLGATATLGYGWRPDALLLVPFLLAGLVACLWHKGRTWRYIGAAAVLFGIGSAGTHRLLDALCPVPRQSSQVGFHMAYYGEYSRCNLVGMEHSLQIPRDDLQAAVNGCAYHAAHQPGTPAPASLSPEYGATCRQMYFESLRYNAYRWLSRFPRFFVQAVHASIGKGLPVLGEFLDVPLPFREPWGAVGVFLAALAALVPWLYLAAIAPVLLFCRQRVLAVILVGFSLYYTVGLVAVLPEYKHAGPMLLPVTVLGGLGIWTLLRLARPARLWADLPRLSRRGLWVATGLLAAGCLLWGGACALAHACAVATRADYQNAIMALAEQGTAVPETVKNPHFFQTTIRPKEPGDNAGYLLKIKAGPQPGQFQCKHLYQYPTLVATERTYITRHQLHPNRVQYFFVTALTHEDFRTHTCTVALNDGAEILSAVRVDMSHWTKLTVSTVFYEGERTPGSPAVGRGLPSGQIRYEVSAADAAALK